MDFKFNWKDKLLQQGFSIQNCGVKSAHVLVYREQHGYEIKYPSFLTQFNDAKIDSTLKLNTKIDNISQVVPYPLIP